MKVSLMLSLLSIMMVSPAWAKPQPTCDEQWDAAKAIATINGGTTIQPAYRVENTPRKTEAGLEFSYEWDVLLQTEGDSPSEKRIGRVRVIALIPNSATKCQVQSLTYTDAARPSAPTDEHRRRY